jgi:hypothetical protein
MKNTIRNPLTLCQNDCRNNQPKRNHILDTRFQTDLESAMFDPLQHQGLKLSFGFPCQHEVYADGKNWKNCIPYLIACSPKIEALIGRVEL